jgi:hypothetical protein
VDISLKGECVAILGLMEGADAEEESFDHLPTPFEVRFPEYSTLSEVEEV